MCACLHMHMGTSGMGGHAEQPAAKRGEALGSPTALSTRTATCKQTQRGFTGAAGACADVCMCMVHGMHGTQSRHVRLHGEDHTAERSTRYLYDGGKATRT